MTYWSPNSSPFEMTAGFSVRWLQIKGTLIAFMTTMILTFNLTVALAIVRTLNRFLGDRVEHQIEKLLNIAIEVKNNNFTSLNWPKFHWGHLNSLQLVIFAGRIVWLQYLSSTRSWSFEFVSIQITFLAFLPSVPHVTEHSPHRPVFQSNFWPCGIRLLFAFSVSIVRLISYCTIGVSST